MTTPAFADTERPGLEAEALDWFVRRGRGLTPDEQAAFEQWIAADHRHGTALARWEADWRALDGLPAEGVARLRAQVAAESAAPARRHMPGWVLALRRGLPRPRALGLACGLVLATLLLWHQWYQAPWFEQRYATRRGEQLEVELPDGSRMRLDTSTRVEVALYRQRREVRLPEGQAVFKVQGDAQKPFDVRAGPVTVTVVGTRFSVRHTPHTPGFEGVSVAVEEGRVRVTGAAPEPAAPAAANLQAGQQVTADAQGLLAPVTPLAGAGIAPWRDGRVTFHNVTLVQALAEFERYGPTGLVLREAAVAQMRLSGTFDPMRLDNFKRALPKVLPVRLSPLGGATEIVAAP